MVQTGNLNTLFQSVASVTNTKKRGHVIEKMEKTNLAFVAGKDVSAKCGGP